MIDNLPQYKQVLPYMLLRPRKTENKRKLKQISQKDEELHNRLTSSGPIMNDFPSKKKQIFLSKTEKNYLNSLSIYTNQNNKFITNLSHTHTFHLQMVVDL